MMLLAWNTEFVSEINDHQGERDMDATETFSRRGRPELECPHRSSSSGSEIFNASSLKKLLEHCTLREVIA
jgi:hypothetical protein